MANILIVKDGNNLIPKLGITDYQRNEWMRTFAIYDINPDGSKSGPYGPTSAQTESVNAYAEVDTNGRPTGQIVTPSGDVVGVDGGYDGKFERLASSPIYSTSMEAAGRGLGAVYSPCVIPAYKYLANPLAKYYLYYSTDHSTWGGIGLALSDSPLGPFQQYVPTGASVEDPACPGTYTNGHPQQLGAIYIDAQVGSSTPNTVWGTPGPTLTPGPINFMQCETPFVIWDEGIGKFRMFYQVGSSNGRPVFSRPAELTASPPLYETFYSSTGNQATLSATSDDGINWTKDRNFIIQRTWSSNTPGDGHSGYFTPSKIGGRWSAYHLWGSTDYGRVALSHAAGPGANNWQTDNRELGAWSYLCGRASDGRRMRVNWTSMALIENNGGITGITGISTFASGTGASEGYLCAFPISRDLRKPLETPSRFSFGALPWESNNLAGTSVMQDGGQTYVYYACKVGGAYNIGVLSFS